MQRCTASDAPIFAREGPDFESNFTKRELHLMPLRRMKFAKQKSAKFIE
jgi:hypothetical protein